MSRLALEFEQSNRELHRDETVWMRTMLLIGIFPPGLKIATRLIRQINPCPAE